MYFVVGFTLLVRSTGNHDRARWEDEKRTGSGKVWRHPYSNFGTILLPRSSLPQKDEPCCPFGAVVRNLQLNAAPERQVVKCETISRKSRNNHE